MSNIHTRPTMKDVAAQAGVSLGTVSKVINGVPVGAEYQQKVEEAIRLLGYEINNYARGLKTNRTQALALIIPNTNTPFFGSLTNAIHNAAARRGYRLTICLSDYDPSREQEFVNMAMRNSVDGIIGLTYNEKLQIPEGLAFVTIDRYFSPRIPLVCSDNFGGGRLACEKLLELGCKRILFLRMGSALTNEPNRRKDGFLSGCQAHHADYETVIINDGDPWSLFDDYLTAHIQDGIPDYDGIFCVSDTLAHYIRKVLKRLGIRVPEQVQLIGFDGIREFGNQEYVCSTFVQPVEDMAEACLQLVLEQDEAKRPRQVCLPVTYAAGGTTRD